MTSRNEVIEADSVDKAIKAFTEAAKRPESFAALIAKTPSSDLESFFTSLGDTFEKAGSTQRDLIGTLKKAIFMPAIEKNIHWFAVGLKALGKEELYDALMTFADLGEHKEKIEKWANVYKESIGKHSTIKENPARYAHGICAQARNTPDELKKHSPEAVATATQELINKGQFDLAADMIIAIAEKQKAASSSKSLLSQVTKADVDSISKGLNGIGHTDKAQKLNTVLSPSVPAPVVAVEPVRGTVRARPVAAAKPATHAALR